MHTQTSVKKVLFTIIGLLLLVGYIGSKIDGESTPASAATPPAAHSAVDSDAAQGLRLSRKGERISNQLVRLSERGLEMAESGNLAGACAVVDAQIQKVNKLGRVVERLRPLVDADTMATLDQNEINLRSSIGEAKRGCLEMGY